jgi:hypothetical protein
LKITLQDITPPIWRRVLVPSEITLDVLHEVIQTAMGWEDDHLHAFHAGRRSFGPAQAELDMADESRQTLAKLAPGPKSKLEYEYDFGDSWEHTLLVEKILPIETEGTYPICTDGARACPPEDCGGSMGYRNMLDIVQNPRHPDYRDIKEWLGRSFDPEKFDKNAVNKRLARLSKSVGKPGRKAKQKPTASDSLSAPLLPSGGVAMIPPSPAAIGIASNQRKAPDAPPYTEPTREEWEALYKAGVDFRNVYPWFILDESVVFGIRNPETGEIGFCCVIGRAGQLTGLNLYMGEQGLAGLWEMRRQIPPYLREDADPTETLFLQDCLSAHFVDREELTKDDYAKIKELGLRFRGAGAWPQFHRYLPGFYPWRLSGPEARFLTIALEQVVAMSRIVLNKRDYLLPPAANGHYLIRERNGDTWEDHWERIILPTPPTPVPAPLDEARVERIKADLPETDGVIEVDTFYIFNPIADSDNSRPYLPLAMMVVDHASGFVLSIGFIAPSALPEAVPRTALDVAEHLKMLPGRVLVKREELFTYLEPTLTRLGIELLFVRELATLDAARNDLMRHLTPPG